MNSATAAADKESLYLLETYTEALCGQWDGATATWLACSEPRTHTLIVERGNLTVMLEYDHSSIGRPYSAAFEKAVDQIMENFVKVFGPIERLH